MKNDLLTIGPFTVHTYGLMIAIGIIAALKVAEYRADKRNLDKDKIWNLTIISGVGGIICAKLLYILIEIKEVIKDPKILLELTNGFVVYGGIIGGVLLGFIYCKKNNLDFLKYFDLAVPSVALAQGFGRIGCFFAGCCYGKVTSGPFAIVYHDSLSAPNGVRLIPTQLMFSGLNFLHFFILIILAKRIKTDGQVSALYIIFYSVGRFIMEYFRGDLDRGNVGLLSTSQFISVFMFLIGCGMFAYRYLMTRYRRQKENH